MLEGLRLPLFARDPSLCDEPEQAGFADEQLQCELPQLIASLTR
jgi:hypothetical protein